MRSVMPGPLAWCGLALGVLCTLAVAPAAPPDKPAETKDPAAAAPRLVLLPGDFTLDGPGAIQSLVLEELRDGHLAGQLAEAVQWHSSDPRIVRVDDGLAVPVANGSATVTARAGGRMARVAVTVTGMDQPLLWSFRNHVQSVLAKAGCSSGACHGAAAGKNGFKLSLRGYDPEGDYRTLTRQSLGRRIVPGDPGRSLLLTKPTGAVPHKGGLRFRVDSREYRVLSEWIAAGTPAPRDDDARLKRLELLPGGAVLRPGMTQQLIVLAHFTDGRVEDVTRWAKYTSANESVAQVDDDGLVRIMGYGEGAITAWYLSQVVVTSVSSPFEQAVAPEVFAGAARRNFIDELVLDKLASLNIPPSPPAGDSEFIRRAFLDTIGVLPTADETRRFLDDTAADKRDRLIESLLARPEFVDYWTYKWSDLLLVNLERLTFGSPNNTDVNPLWAYYSWIRNRVEANTPWDQLVAELITASGSNLQNGAANFFLLHQDPLDLAETTTVAFLGTSINCARCHNHPLEKWTNNQYYAFANLFARVRAKAAPGRNETIIFTSAEGELIQPLVGRPQPPAPLDGPPLDFDSATDRRRHLADWLTAPDNPHFSRSITNRVWANFFGVGLVEKVDDMRASNPASNEVLLSAAADYLVRHRFDLKVLMRAILQSAAYQRTSAPLAENAADDRFYSRYYPKRLMAEVLLDAVSHVTAVPTPFKGYPSGWRALQLPSSTVNSYFLATFGRPERIVTCDCERSSEPSMVQVLHISNGETLNGKLQAKGNAIDRALSAKIGDGELVDELFLSALSRPPTADEKRRLLAELAAARDDRRQALEDLYWGVLSSREFLFNH